jgi:hypothetical protein
LCEPPRSRLVAATKSKPIAVPIQSQGEFKRCMYIVNLCLCLIGCRIVNLGRSVRGYPQNLKVNSLRPPFLVVDLLRLVTHGILKADMIEAGGPCSTPQTHPFVLMAGVRFLAGGPKVSAVVEVFQQVSVWWIAFYYFRKSKFPYISYTFTGKLDLADVYLPDVYLPDVHPRRLSCRHASYIYRLAPHTQACTLRACISRACIS